MEFRREVSTFGGGFRKKHGAEAGPWFLKSDPQITPYRWGVASKSAPSKNIRLARLKIPVSSKKNACHFDDKIIEIPWGLLKIPVSSKKSACHFDDEFIWILDIIHKGVHEVRGVLEEWPQPKTWWVSPLKHWNSMRPTQDSRFQLEKCMSF